MARTSNKQYYMSNMFPLVDVVEQPGEPAHKRIDIFNPDGAKFVRSLQPQSKIPWSARNKLDVIALRSFNTVSGWWIPLFYNGAEHPFEIINGSYVVIPVADQAALTTRARTGGRAW